MSFVWDFEPQQHPFFTFAFNIGAKTISVKNICKKVLSENTRLFPVSDVIISIYLVSCMYVHLSYVQIKHTRQWAFRAGRFDCHRCYQLTPFNS
jgi:hypothetical protein